MNLAAQDRTGQTLPAWLWLWAPSACLLIVPLLFVFYPAEAQELIGRENGIPDIGTPIVLIPGVIAGMLCYPLRKNLPATWLHTWLMLMVAASIFFAGEETSWGQSFFHWQSPELFNQLNKQQETNLHNMSSWFNQKPRILLALGVLIGGIVLPLLRKWRGTQYIDRDWRFWFWPDFVCLPAGLLVFLVKIPERYADLTGRWPFDTPIRVSELQEFYFAYFLMLYLVSWYVRLKCRAG